MIPLLVLLLYLSVNFALSYFKKVKYCGYKIDENENFGEWKLVRRVKPGKTWHPSNDYLLGINKYCNSNNSNICNGNNPLANNTFSIPFDINKIDEFLITDGDCKRWLIMHKHSIMSNHSNILRLNNSIESALNVIYAENNETMYSNVLKVHNGNNVFVRSRITRKISNRRHLNTENDLNEIISIYISCDNIHTAYFNGIYLGSGSYWRVADEYSGLLRYGKNVIAIKGEDTGGAAWCLVYYNSSNLNITGNSSSNTWLVTTEFYNNWTTITFNDSTWIPATVSDHGSSVSNWPTVRKPHSIWGNEVERVVYFRHEIEAITLSPTQYPTKYPSKNPTGDPTSQSMHPSDYPTEYPSSFPTRQSNEPSNIPTKHPSKFPTEQSDKPIDFPTQYPSKYPTQQSKPPIDNPSKYPTEYHVTKYPTTNPIVYPTSYPIVPTGYPTYSTEFYQIVMQGIITLETSYNSALINETSANELEKIMYSSVITAFGFENDTNLIIVNLQEISPIDNNTRISIDYVLFVYDPINTHDNYKALKDDITPNNTLKNDTIANVINETIHYNDPTNNDGNCCLFDNSTNVLFSIKINVPLLDNDRVELSTKEVIIIILFSILGIFCCLFILCIYVCCRKNERQPSNTNYTNVGENSNSISLGIVSETELIDFKSPIGYKISAKNTAGDEKEFVISERSINEIFSNEDITKYIKNPCVVIIGASDYSNAIVNDNHNIQNLPQVRDDIISTKNMFKNIYNYSHIYAVMDKILNKNDNKMEYINPKNLQNYLQKIRTKIEIINHEILNEDSSTSDSSDASTNEPLIHKSTIDETLIDCLIIIISGHGNENGFITNTGEVFNFENLEEIFSNDKFNALNKSPKIFIIDTCRGNDVITWKIKMVTSKGTFTHNETSDIFYFFATTNNKQAYIDNINGGSYLINGIINVFSDKQTKGKINLNEIATRVKKYVLNTSDGIQTSETVNRLHYNVIFE